MSQLINEILLRLAKLVVAGIVASIIYVVAVGAGVVAPSFQVAVLCWIAAAAGLLLVESSPI